jgi:hypothetical protein
MTHRNNIFANIEPQPKHRVSALLAAGWARVISKVGRGAFSDKLDISDGTVGNALSGKTVPELHTALNSLAIDPTALDELMAGYGFRIQPLHASAANDIATAAGVINAMGELVRALDDNHRDHNETLAIAGLLRPHMPALMAIIGQADELRGAA